LRRIGATRWAVQNRVCLRRVRGPRCGLVAPCGSGQPAAMRLAPFAASCPRGYRVDGAIVLVLCGPTAHRPASGGRDPMRKTADLAYNGRNSPARRELKLFRDVSTQSPRYSVRARSSTATGQTTPDRVTATVLRDRRDGCGGPGQPRHSPGTAAGTAGGRQPPARTDPGPVRAAGVLRSPGRDVTARCGRQDAGARERPGRPGGTAG
jgi:hypothetical protein